jgi:hypothetical protein
MTDFLDSLIGDVEGAANDVGADVSGALSDVTDDVTGTTPAADGGGGASDAGDASGNDPNALASAASVPAGGVTQGGDVATQSDGSVQGDAPAASSGGGGGTVGTSQPAPLATTPASAGAGAGASWWSRLTSSPSVRTGGIILLAAALAAGAGYGLYRGWPWIQGHAPKWAGLRKKGR